jgi:hypothetical protein
MNRRIVASSALPRSVAKYRTEPRSALLHLDARLDVCRLPSTGVRQITSVS